MGLGSRSQRPNGGDCEVAVEPAFREDREAELDSEMAAPHLRKNPNEHPAGEPADPSADGSRVEGKRRRRRESERLPLVGAGQRTEAEVFLDAAQKARGKSFGAAPDPARGTPPGIPASFPSGPRFRNGPRRQGFAAPRKTGAPLTAPGRSDSFLR